MIGIYKITNPKGKVYIGQSINLEKRINQYKTISKSISEQPAIYNSLLKYGIDLHTFEIIEQCELNLLNSRERYYQELYCSVKKGLNCKYTTTNDKTGHLSEETKNKISLAQKGKPRFYKSGVHPRLGTKMSDETIFKMVNNRSYKVSEEYKQKVSLFFKGKKLSQEQKTKISISNTGQKRTEKTKSKISESWNVNSKERIQKMIDNNTNRKIVLDLYTGVYYNSLKELCEINNFNNLNTSRKLSGYSKNTTNFIYA
jgi:group I intron endonuclease